MKKTDQGAPARLLTIQDAAAAIGCSVKTLRRRIEDGALPVFRDGRLIRIHPDDLARFINSRRS